MSEPTIPETLRDMGEVLNDMSEVLEEVDEDEYTDELADVSTQLSNNISQVAVMAKVQLNDD